jgi:acyl-CoA thioesterase YciA
MELITQHSVMDKHLNGYHTLFGGVAMSWLDEAAAFLAGATMGSNHCVTKVMKEVIFENPAYEGDLIRLSGKVKHRGNTSITVTIKMCSFSNESSKTTLICVTDAVFVDMNRKKLKDQGV